MSSGIPTARRAVSRVFREDTRRESLHSAKHIELQGVPRSATPADVRRALTRAKVQGVADVALEYAHFRPTQRALLTLTRPDFLRDNLRALEKATISGIPIRAGPKTDAPEVFSRVRGARGREEAAQRGLFTGNGPNAGISNGEKKVTLWGLPGKIEGEGVQNLAKGFKIVGAEAGKPEIVKIALPQGEFSMVSRFLISLPSTSEAHRFVRELHLTHYQPELHGTKFPIRARVLY